MLLKHIDKSKEIKTIEEFGFVIVLITFFIGIVIGAISLKNVPDAEFTIYQSDIANGLNVQNDGRKLMHDTVKMVIIFEIAGLSIVGIPLLIVFIGYRGYCLGYAISSLARVTNFSIISRYVICNMLLRAIFMIFSISFLGNYALKLLSNFITNHHNVKNNMIIYAFYGIFMIFMSYLIAKIP